MTKTEIINGVIFAYNKFEGEGAAVVLLHGWGCTRATLASIEKIALAAGRPVINVDFPGFGDSTEPPTVWGVEEYTQAFEELTFIWWKSRYSLCFSKSNWKVRPC